jgi:hypothetical protein
MLRVVEVRPAGDEDDPVLVVEPVDECALRRSTAERKLEQHAFTQTAAAKVRTRAGARSCKDVRRVGYRKDVWSRRPPMSGFSTVWALIGHVPRGHSLEALKQRGWPHKLNSLGPAPRALSASEGVRALSIGVLAKGPVETP